MSAALATLSLAVLKDLCREAGVPITGSKAQLATYLANPEAHQKGKRKAPGQGAGAIAKAAKLYKEVSSTPEALADAPAALVSEVAGASAALSAHVSSLAKTVDADWHDSYEETNEELCIYAEVCRKAAAAALHLAFTYGAFDQCHLVLLAISDTWADINCIPFRCGPDVIDEASNDSIEVDFQSTGGGDTATVDLGNPQAVVNFAWPLLLAKVAGDAAVSDGILFRLIKDAFDNRTKEPQKPSETEGELPAGVVFGIEAGRARIAALFDRRAEWDSLTTTVKKHKMRRGIDRRFDGPKHMRTRNFSDSDGGGGDY
ncbi:hypothetical protein M885DRAFT_540121 [Pelagophyceae sp. CCMP2097]|nr:hypothetical protein M885DRAFT_540121 [Pelagophyceae sp. CCMP2097]